MGEFVELLEETLEGVMWAQDADLLLPHSSRKERDGRMAARVAEGEELPKMFTYGGKVPWEEDLEAAAEAARAQLAKRAAEEKQAR